MKFDKIYYGKNITNFKSEGKVVTVENDVQPCIEKSLYDFAQSKIKDINDRKEGGKRGGGNNLYLLSRKIHDTETGKTLVGYKRRDGSYGYRRKGFTDSNGIKYKNIDVTGKELDDFVWGFIEQAIRDPKEFFYLFKKQLESGNDLDRLKDDLEIYKNQLSKKQEALDTIEIRYIEGLYSEKQRERLVNTTQSDIKNIEINIVKLDLQIENLIKITYSEEIIKRMSEKYKDNLEKLTLKQRQIIIESTVENITVTKTKEGDLKIIPLFKFDLSESEKKFIKDEHKKSTNKGKPKGANDVSSVNGGSSGARTQDLLLKRELLYQLS